MDSSYFRCLEYLTALKVPVMGDLRESDKSNSSVIFGNYYFQSTLIIYFVKDSISYLESISHRFA